MDRDQKLFFFFNIYCSHESSQKQDFFFFICNLLGRNANLNFQNQEWLYTTKFPYTNVLSTTISSYYSNIVSRTTVNKLIKPADQFLISPPWHITQDFWIFSPTKFQTSIYN